MPGPEASDCNCLAIRKAARQVTQLYDSELSACGLRATQYSVLAILDRLERARVQVLAEALVMDRSTLGHNLRPLERDGLIELSVDPDDARARSLRLTRLGRDRLRAARPAWLRAQKRFEAQYGISASRRLRKLLQGAVTSVEPQEA